MEKKDLVQETINRTDWRIYEERLSWLVSKPTCPLYDGNVLCNYWKVWIINGRRNYPNTREGESEYLNDVRENTYRIREIDLHRLLKELKRELKSPLGRLFYVGDSQKTLP
ncbi:MAG: hypothetical protein AABW65_02290 [Nanoarchaeota archaeon]